MPRQIEPIVHVAADLQEADAWDREQMRQLTLDERLTIAEVLRQRVYGSGCPDVREAERRA